MTATTLESRTQWRSPGRKVVGIWLLAVALIIVGMVTLGGLTRLTGSGLSITEWHPVTGVVPPLSQQDWQTEFAKYKQIPQYVRENRWMSLDDFKAIYWWEWTHRLLGRLLGVVFLLPFLWFAWTGAIARREWPRMVVLFALGGLQGFVGWWMVESGLETRVAVSQYRLAIHLGTAIVLLGAILWTALEYFYPPRVGVAAREARRGRSPAAYAFVGLVYVQMLLGALVAGLHAGLIYNTWPSMDGHVFPEAPFFSKPWWVNFFENPGLAQFDHRVGAYIVFMSAIALWYAARRAKFSGLARTSADAVLGITLFQVALGICTLLNQAPVVLAALHQVTAATLFCAALWHAFELRRTFTETTESPPTPYRPSSRSAQA
jgi:cytochrome c oxidase assembly protein subunit 15